MNPLAHDPQKTGSIPWVTARLSGLAWRTAGGGADDFRTLVEDVAELLVEGLELDLVYVRSALGGGFLLRGDGIRTALPERVEQAVVAFLSTGDDEGNVRIDGVNGPSLRLAMFREGGPARPVELVLGRLTASAFPTHEGRLVAELAACRLAMAMQQPAMEISGGDEHHAETLRRAFHQQSGFAVLLALDGTVLEANEACFLLSGMTRGDVLGAPLWRTPWWESVTAGRDEWQAVILETARTGKARRCEITCDIPTMGARLITTRVIGLKDARGVATNLLIEARDDTDRLTQETALRQSEERLRLALEAGRMGVWDWNIRTGELSWSDSLEPLHGLKPGTFGGTFEDFQNLIHPEDRAMVNQAIQRAVEEGSGYDIELRNIRPSGAVHWIAGQGKVFLASDGNPERMIGIGMDITTRKRAEQTARFLAEASGELAALVDYESTLSMLTSLAVPHFADWAAVDLAAGPETLRRVSVAHVDPAKVDLALELHRRFPPDPAAPHGAWNVLRTGEPELVCEITDDLLVRSVRSEEHLRIVRDLGLKSYIVVPLKARGSILGVLSFVVAESGYHYNGTDLAVAEDLAGRASIAIENAELYRSLREADQRKDEFVATLAHELRNPLAPIRSGLEVLRLGGSDPERSVATREMMERQLNQMVRLVDDLLDVSRITRNRLELRPQRVELKAVVRAAVETSLPAIEKARHDFSLRIPEAPVFLDADPARLAQVFSNLLTNSAKYTDPGGRISLEALVEEGEVSVCIRDNGIGIPPESLPDLFQMFSQVGDHGGRAQGGLGIGLMLVRRLVELHGGTVAARSDGPGQGAEVEVRLPAAAPAASTREPAPELAPAGISQLRILIVDDNYDAALSLAIMLELMGHEVRTAHDGPSAIHLAREFVPELILLDIGLPGMSGHEACQQIRRQRWAAEVMIVAVTGWGQEEDRRRSVEAGFDHHLTKPVEIAVLEELIGHQSRRQGGTPDA